MKTRVLFILIVLISCSKDPTIIPSNRTFTDSRDGNVYRIVKIGEQTWMAENLAYLPLVSKLNNADYDKAQYYVGGYYGTNVSEAKASQNYKTDGVFYNWEAAKTACPDGWYLPSDDEWKKLEIDLGMSVLAADSNSFRFSGEVGKKLKSKSGWADYGNGDNKSGFSALPIGMASAWYDFFLRDSAALFWSSTEDGGYSSCFRLLYYLNNAVFREWDSKVDGLSVRCYRYE